MEEEHSTLLCKKHSLWQLINQKHTVRKCTCHASIYKVTLDSISKLNQECAWKPLSHLLNNPILMVWPSSAASTHVHDSTLIITVAHDDVIKYTLFSALLAICAGNSPVTGEFPAQRPVTRSFDIYFDLRLNKRLSKKWRCWWFETPARHCNVIIMCRHLNVRSSEGTVLNTNQIQTCYFYYYKYFCFFYAIRQFFQI